MSSVGQRIKEIRIDNGLTQAKFAERIFRDKSAISKLEHDNSTLSPAIAKAICSTFGVREKWLLKGDGEKTEELQNTEMEKLTIELASRETPKRHPLDSSMVFKNYRGEKMVQGNAHARFRISDALTMCSAVLESGTSYAGALYHNLVHFDRAVKNEQEHNTCKADLEKANKTISEMRTRMDGMEEDLKKMKKEMKDLREHSGGSAPIDLSMANAAPTGTDDKEM